jgi:hypothetical protein
MSFDKAWLPVMFMQLAWQLFVYINTPCSKFHDTSAKQFSPLY